MMTSRYQTSEQRSFRAGDGTVVSYLAPRILPFGWTLAGPLTTQVRADEVDRLDRLATRVLHNPLLAWKIADVNDAMDPFEACAHAGQLLQVPAPDL